MGVFISGPRMKTVVLMFGEDIVTRENSIWGYIGAKH